MRLAKITREMYPSSVRTVWMALGLLSLSVSLAEAAPIKLVRPGREIAVAPVRLESLGTLQRQAATKAEVRLPSTLGLQSSGRREDITVVGFSGRFVRQSSSLVPADEAAIAKACDEILAENGDKQLRCEPNVIFTVMGVPNDSRYESLYGLKKMRLPLAWDITTGSRSVIVAVVDSGIDYTHDDLQNNIVVNTREIPGNGIDDDGNGYIDDVRGYDFVDQDADPMDINGHGTHCAGVIGAQGNNGLGVVGVNWNVGLLPVRVLTNEGSGSLSDVSAGIVYAVNRGASVINLSLGSPDFSQILEDAIQYAQDNDVLIVAAAGNDGSDNDKTPVYPASSTKSNVITVAASTPGDILAYFSNYGVDSVDVAAPGDGIVSTIPNNSYTPFDGTSMAAPHVAGLAALLKSLDTRRSSSDIRNVILGTVVLRAGMREKISTGGRVDALAAVQALSQQPAPTATPTPPLNEPQVTPTPRPSGGLEPKPTPIAGGDTPLEVARLTLRAVVKAKAAIMFGNAYSAQDVGLGGKAISLGCSGKRVGDVTTFNDGSYLFRIKRTSRAQRCACSTSNGVSSPTVRIRKR
jgi:subtilisin family serine protease